MTLVMDSDEVEANDDKVVHVVQEYYNWQESK